MTCYLQANLACYKHKMEIHVHVIRTYENVNLNYNSVYPPIAFTVVLMDSTAVASCPFGG